MKYFVNSIILLVLFLITPHNILAQDTIRVTAGWNMIGAKLSGQKSGFTSLPAGIISSEFYGFTSGAGYSSVQTLKENTGYWVKVNQAGVLIPGNHQPAIPDNLLPVNTSTNVSPSPLFVWSCSDPDNELLTYDVYLGTTTPPTTRISSGLSNPYLNWSGLERNTLYYWRIVAIDNHNSYSVGPTWQFTTHSSTCGEAIEYDGRGYNTVLIGTQCWFAENLDIGTMVNGSSNQTNNGTIEKYCYSDNTANCVMYGGFYQWNEAMQYSTTAGAQGICPSGWHIPTLEEFQTLQTMVNDDGNALKAIGQGTNTGVGTNTSGFSALLSGFRNYQGLFMNLGLETYVYSSTEYDVLNAYKIVLGKWGSEIFYSHLEKTDAYSIRCLKD